MIAGTLKSALHGEPRGHEELRLTIQNDLGELARVNELVSELLVRRGVDESVVYTTELALEEVLSNVIRHGYDDGGQHEIALDLRVREGGVELQVVDDGLEFDPRSAPEVDVQAPLAQRKVGGLGIHLVRSMVSDIQYERMQGKNRLRVRI